MYQKGRGNIYLANNTLQANVGKCCNNEFGIFTAPRDGLYKFSIQGTNKVRTTSYINIEKNGKSIIEKIRLPPKDKAGSSPTEWFMELEKRDCLQAQLFYSNHKPSEDVILSGQLLTSPWSAFSVI